MNSASSPKLSIPSMPTINNIQLLLQIQIALVGIILVAGLFFLWKALTRVDEKIDLLAFQFKKITVAQTATPPATPSNPLMQVIDQMMGGGMQIPMQMSFPQSQQNDFVIHQNSDNNDDDENEDDEDEDDDDDEDDNPPQLLQGSSATFVVFTSQQSSPPPQTSSSEFKIEDITEEEDKKEKEKEDKKEKESAKSEELTNPLSKSKLSSMKVEELRTLCSDRGLSTDGLKPELVNRLLGIRE